MEIASAFKRAIEAYWEGKEPQRLKKEQKGKVKYDKKYFDKAEKEALGSNADIDLWGKVENDDT